MACLVTTARNACKRTRMLAHDLASMVPNAAFVPRGKKSIEDVAEESRKQGFAKAVVITDREGNPGAIRFMDVTRDDWKWSLEKNIHSVKLLSDYGAKPEVDALEVRDTIGLAQEFEITPRDSEFTFDSNKERLVFTFNGKEVGPRVVFA